MTTATAVLCEIEFTLQFVDSFDVPYDASDKAARIETATVKVVPAGGDKTLKKNWTGALLVRDRYSNPPGAPTIKRAIVVHSTGAPLVELPPAAGRLVGNFSSHNGQHHWFVFAPREAPEVATSPREHAASPRASIDGNGIHHLPPDRAPKHTPASIPLSPWGEIPDPSPEAEAKPFA